MGRNKRRKHRNLNGLHEEVVTPLPGGLSKLPRPTTPLQDMKILAGDRGVPFFMSDTVQRLAFL